MTADQIVFASLSAALALIGVGLTIRNWVYGGSVIRVEIELARRESWGTLVTGTVARWRDGVDQTGLTILRVGPRGTEVDLVKVTVRNLGRTAATIHDVGLRIGLPPTARGSWTGMPLRMLSLGEEASIVRVEAHDVKVFYFHAVPILRGAREAFGNVPMAVRAAVMTGTGKQRLSRRWRRGTWNVWRVLGDVDRSITGLPLTTRELARLWVELTEETFEPSIMWVRQITDQAADLVDAGLSKEEVVDVLRKTYSIFGPQDNPSRDHHFMDALTDYLFALRSTNNEVSEVAP